MARKHNSALSASVLKAVGIFGGVQSVGILCSILRTKLVAVWIGAVGVGLFGIYNSAVDMISALAQMGLRNSAVRDVAAASDASARARIVAVVRRWGWALGILGAIATVSLAPMLSRWSFGDIDHVWHFVALSVAILLGTVTCCEQAILQGHERLKQIARATMWGLVAALAVSVPLFYFFREDGVLPSVIAYSTCIFIAVMAYRYRPLGKTCSMSLRETAREGRGFVVLGIYMTISFFAAMIAQYAFLAYLNQVADTDTVGYYQAGWTITTRYVGMVFTAICMEYFPRLSKVNGHPRRCGLFVSHEMTMALWLLLPMIMGLIVCRQLVVWILYTPDFYVMLPYVSWAMIGTILRAVSWCMSFVILAKGDGPIYLVTELSSAVLSVIINIVCYNLWGFWGLGVGYILWYGLYTLMVWLVYHYRYRMSLSRGLFPLSIAMLGVCATCVLAMDYDMMPLAIVLTLAATFVAFRKLKRMVRR